MKLGSLRDGTPDGQLVVVNRTLTECRPVPDIARTLQDALDRWDEVHDRLRRVSETLDRDARQEAHECLVQKLHAPLPRAFQWLDGSAYLRHVELVRRARGADLPPGAREEPLMYQGVSAPFLAWNDPIPLGDPSWGVDFEAELVVVTGPVPTGADRARCAASIRLIGLANDISLRGLIPSELAKGFGFLHGKPPTALAPVLATPDEIEDAWDGARAWLDVHIDLNGERVAHLRSGEDMHFSFVDLIRHACMTRPLCAGTIVGAGTISNFRDGSGYGCIAERRATQMLDGAPCLQRWLDDGDEVAIDAHLGDATVFGAIRQAVRALPSGPHMEQR